MYIVKYKGQFAFIKPWSSVRDLETYSQRFLTPSIVEGIEKRLFPELLKEKGIKKILRHRLYAPAMVKDQEVIQSKGYEFKSNTAARNTGVIIRYLLLYPVLYLAFATEEDAKRAEERAVCLCRNEDLLFPEGDMAKISESEFSKLPGFELRFGKTKDSFMVGYNRYDDGKPMYGYLEYVDEN